MFKDISMDIIFIRGAFFISFLQSRFPKLENFFTWASYFGDPKYSYLFHFPILFAFSRKSGFQLLIAVCISECINLILKWILQEDRPYWWVNEHAEKVGNLTLRQFPITCEAGPGSPSGHVMVSTSVFYVVIYSLVHKKSLMIRMMAWSTFVFVIGAIATSRMFLASHFPHQCLLGFIIGIALGSIIRRVELASLSSRNLISLGVLLLASTMSTYTIQKAMDVDPDQSIRLALKWCVKLSYVRVDTIPLFNSMRYTGVLLGSGIAVWRLTWRRFIVNNPYSLRFSSMVLGLTACCAIIYCPLPTKPNLMYTFSFVQYTALFLTLVRMIPEFLLWCYGITGQKYD